MKTEASQKPVPLDAYVANDLLAWYSAAEYVKPEDYVFSSSASRAGKHRGKQPLWLAKVMQYHIHPAAERAGILRNYRMAHLPAQPYTTLLHANGESVKVVQELLRHGSAKITMDVYAQAVTRTSERRNTESWLACVRRTQRWHAAVSPDVPGKN